MFGTHPSRNYKGDLEKRGHMSSGTKKESRWANVFVPPIQPSMLFCWQLYVGKGAAKLPLISSFSIPQSPWTYWQPCQDGAWIAGWKVTGTWLLPGMLWSQSWNRQPIKPQAEGLTHHMPWRELSTQASPSSWQESHSINYSQPLRTARQTWRNAKIH
jgi:hypothetical protein